MPSLGGIAKYIGLLSIGKGFVDKTVFQRLLQGIAAVVGLSVIAGILVGAIVLGLLGLQYHTMISAGLSDAQAIIITALTIGLIVAIIVYKIVQLVRTIASYSSLLAQPASPVAPVTDAITDIFNAFVKGLKEKSEVEETEEEAPTRSSSRSKKYPKSVK